MGKTLYLECYSGISGDMTVAALLDLGADRDVLEKALYSLPIGGFHIEISRVKKSGLDACDFNVILNHEITMTMIWNTCMDMHGKDHEHNILIYMSIHIRMSIVECARSQKSFRVRQ